MASGSKRVQVTVYIAVIMTGIACVMADFHLLDGGIVKKGGGSLNFDMNDNGIADIVMTNEGRLGVGTISPQSSIEVSGSLGFNVQTVSSDITLSGNSVVLSDTSVQDLVLTLPEASTVNGRVYRIKKISAINSLLIQTSSGNIDFSGNIELTTATVGYPWADLYSNGAQWYVMSTSVQ